MCDPFNHLGSIQYHLEPLEVPHSTNQYLDRDFFATSYSKAALMPPDTGRNAGTIRHELSRAWLNFFLAGSTIAPLFLFSMSHKEI